MLEAKITIVAPELAAAINNLAAAMGGAKAQTAVTPPTAPVTNPATPPMNPPVAPTAQAPTQPAAPPVNNPVAHTAMPGAAPVSNAPAGNYAAPGVPLAQPPQYTFDQIMAAGAMLMDAGKVNDLMNLLHSFGVQAVMDLKPEQLGAFATALRNLGAKI